MSAAALKGVVINVADDDVAAASDAQCCTAHNSAPMVAVAGEIGTRNNITFITRIAFVVGGDSSGADVLRLVKCDTSGKFVDVASTPLPDAPTALAWRGDLVREFSTVKWQFIIMFAYFFFEFDSCWLLRTMASFWPTPFLKRALHEAQQDESALLLLYESRLLFFLHAYILYLKF
jgi:hypothetical protein